LPIYTIKDELTKGDLISLSQFTFNLEKFGVWYLRDRKSLRPFAEKAVNWLQSNSSSMEI
jgi:hypothetical protein